VSSIAGSRTKHIASKQLLLRGTNLAMNHLKNELPQSQGSDEPTGSGSLCTRDPCDPLDAESSSSNAGPPIASMPESPVQQSPPLDIDPNFATKPLWLKRSDQYCLGVLATAALAVFVVDYSRILGWRAQPVEILRAPDTEYQYKLDVNRATWVEWSLLDGIGEVLGKRIVEDRQQKGPFRSVDDVMRVRGIGPKKMEQMRPWLEIRDGERFADGPGTNNDRQ
jgi:competence protein ComEA